MEQRKVIRLSELVGSKNLNGKLPVSKATIWRWVRSGRFPKPFKLSERVTVWDAKEVDNFIEKSIRGET
jgi:predicted DNA-binding transcriptional regulator AlpA